LPIIRSITQSPTRVFSSTIAGRSSILTLFLIWPLPPDPYHATDNIYPVDVNDGVADHLISCLSKYTDKYFRGWLTPLRFLIASLIFVLGSIFDVTLNQSSESIWASFYTPAL
jgi:hypothetical protein